MWNKSPKCRQETTAWGLYLGAWRSWSPWPRPSQGPVIWRFRIVVMILPMTKNSPGPWVSLKSGQVRGQFGAQDCTSCTAEIVPDVFRTEETSKLMGSDIVLYQYISAILDLLGTVRLAKNLVRGMDRKCWMWHEPDHGAVRGIPTVLSSSPGWFCWVKGEGWRRCAIVSTHERDDIAMLDHYVSIILQVPLMIQVHQVT